MDFINLFLHLDQHLIALVNEYGTFTYVILFLIIFCETGLVITPFLPGDSLLFVAGTLAATGSLDLGFMLILLSGAAILGDTINYWIGAIIGPKIFHKENVRFLNKKHLDTAHAFYEKHGTFAIIMGRFMPIIRTFVPFVAGIGKMNYREFMGYNSVGGIAWIWIFLIAGYFFGNVPIIKENLTVVILGIVFISLLPPIIKMITHKK